MAISEVRAYEDAVLGVKRKVEEHRKKLERKIDGYVKDLQDMAVDLAREMDVDDVIALIESDRITDDDKYPMVMTWVYSRALDESDPFAVTVLLALNGCTFGSKKRGERDGEDE